MSSAIYTQSLRPVISEIYCHTSHLWTCEEFHCHYWSGTHNTRMHTHAHCIRLPKETRRFMIDPMVCGFTVLSSFIIQIKYGLPYCVTCPSMSRDPGSLNPGTRRSRVPGWWSVRILGQVTQFWQNIHNLHYNTGSWKLFWYPLLAICVRGRQCE